MGKCEINEKSMASLCILGTCELFERKDYNKRYRFAREFGDVACVSSCSICLFLTLLSRPSEKHIIPCNAVII